MKQYTSRRTGLRRFSHRCRQQYSTIACIVAVYPITEEANLTGSTLFCTDCETMDTFGKVYLLMKVILAIVITISNALVLVVINCTTDKLRTIPNQFVSSLAAADMLVGVIGIPCSIIVFFRVPYGDYESCTLLNTANLIFTGISVFCIFAIATERFVAIKHPYSYQSSYFGQHSTRIVAITWTIGILSNMVPVFGWRVAPPHQPEACTFMKTINLQYMVYVRFFICHLIPMIAIPVMYGYIFLIVLKQSKSLSELDVHCLQKERQRRKIRRERRAARALVALVVVFLICVLPIDIMNALTIFAGRKWAHTEILPVAFLIHLNSAINPFINAFANKDVRESTKRLFGLNVQRDFITDTSDTHSPTKTRRTSDNTVTVSGAVSTNRVTSLVGHFHHTN